MMSDRAPQLIYFDLGNVLLLFDHEIAVRQMAEVSGVPPDRVRDIVFNSGLELRYERGDVTSQEFHEAFCSESGTRPDFDALMLAGSKIFELNVPVVSIVANLYSARHRLGILSNTCEAHWEYAGRGRYAILTDCFDVYALSYQLGGVKPEPQVFASAADLAGVAPRDIFYVDDRMENVEAAREAGYDAVQFTEANELASQIRARDIQMNL